MALHELSKDFLDHKMRQGKVVIKFTAKWCGPCQKIHHDLRQACASESFELIEVDVDTFGDLAEEFNVSGIPDMRIAAGPNPKRIKVVGANLEEVKAAMRKLNASEAETKIAGNIPVLPDATIH